MPKTGKWTSTLYALVGYLAVVLCMVCAGAFVLGYIPGQTP